MTDDELERRLDREERQLLATQRLLRERERARLEWHGRRVEDAWDPDRYVSPDAFTNMEWLLAGVAIVLVFVQFWLMYQRLYPLQYIAIGACLLTFSVSHYCRREARRLRALQSR